MVEEKGSPRGERFRELERAGFSPRAAERIIKGESKRGKETRKEQARSVITEKKLSQAKQREETRLKIQQEKRELGELKKARFAGSGVGRFLSGTGKALRTGAQKVRSASKRRSSTKTRRSPRTRTMRNSRSPRRRSPRRPKKSSVWTFT